MRSYTARKPVGSGSDTRPSAEYSPLGKLQASPYINAAAPRAAEYVYSDIGGPRAREPPGPPGPPGRGALRDSSSHGSLRSQLRSDADSSRGSDALSDRDVSERDFSYTHSDDGERFLPRHASYSDLSSQYEFDRGSDSDSVASRLSPLARDTPPPQRAPSPRESPRESPSPPPTPPHAPQPPAPQFAPRAPASVYSPVRAPAARAAPRPALEPLRMPAAPASSSSSVETPMYTPGTPGAPGAPEHAPQGAPPAVPPAAPRVPQHAPAVPARAPLPERVYMPDVPAPLASAVQPAHPLYMPAAPANTRTAYPSVPPLSAPAAARSIPSPTYIPSPARAHAPALAYAPPPPVPRAFPAPPLEPEPEPEHGEAGAGRAYTSSSENLSPSVERRRLDARASASPMSYASSAAEPEKPAADDELSAKLGAYSAYVQRLRADAGETHVSKPPATLPLGIRGSRDARVPAVKPEFLRKVMDIKYTHLPQRMIATEVDDDDDDDVAKGAPAMFAEAGDRPASPVESVIEPAGKIKLFVANPDDL